MNDYSLINTAKSGLALTLLMLIAGADARELIETRRDVEEVLAGFSPSSLSTPDQRFAHAEALFKLGNIWQASTYFAKQIRPSGRPQDVELAADIARLTMDLERAERLYTRLLDLPEYKDRARRGLLLTYYHQQAFDKVISLYPDGVAFDGPFAGYLAQYEGIPYGIEWIDAVARLPFKNDVMAPGALPEVEIMVNGLKVLLTIDTGGDRLYLDTNVAEKAAIRNIVISQAKYAYTGGRTIDEPLGVADTVSLGGVVLTNVPTTVAQWQAHGLTTDGVLGTAILKQFLTTIDYNERAIVLRPRRTASALRDALGEGEMVRIPFVLSATHLMFAKGEINGHRNQNLFVDSGLAMTMPMVVPEETVERYKLKKNQLAGTQYYWVTIDSHGFNGLPGGRAQALGNVFVDANFYRNQGFFNDALISHQYLRALGSWTIDFDSMSFFFPR